MASVLARDETYPGRGRGRGAGGVWRVVLLAVGLIAIAIAISVLGEALPPAAILAFVGALAVVGVVGLFTLAAGLVRFNSGDGEGARTLHRAVVEALPFGAVVADREGRVSYANGAYVELGSGLSNGAPVGVPRLFAGYPEASEAIYRLSRAARDSRPALEDVRLASGFGGGAAAWYRIAVRALPESEGSDRPLVLWSVEDITRDRDRREGDFLELQRSVDYLDHAPAGFFSADRRGRVRYLNSTLADWLGHDLAAFEPGTLGLADIVRGDGASLLMRGNADGEIGTEVIDIDLVKRDGTLVPARLLHRAARRADGELGETRTLVLDRRSGVEGEEALRASEVRFSRFFNDTPFAIATLDRDGRIIRTNAPFSRIFGWSGSERALDRVIMTELLSDASRAPFAEAMEEAAANRSEISPVDAQLAREGDHAVRLYLSGSEEIAGSPERVNVYALDTTEQRKLEARLSQSQKMQAVGQLAGGVAHDFNNMLTAIIGFTDLLLLKHKMGEPNFADLMAIKQSANRAAGLTRQLLAFSRRQTLRPQILDVPSHINELTEMLKPLIGEQVTLQVEHDAPIWPVKADPVQLVQVVMNLVVNARDAMPSGGVIKLATRNVPEVEAAELAHTGMPPADYVLLVVADTGTGMAPEVMEKVFEPFFSTKDHGKGTGLGLSTVYGIIKQTGGFIYPESKLGAGTVFSIYLPRHIPIEGEVTALPAPLGAVAKDLTGRERILLVEDEDSVRAFSARALRATGYEVFEADSGDEALHVLEEIGGAVDLMISDVVMPEMDGPALLLRVREKLPDLKVIFVSGYAEENVRQDIADDRSVDFLAKPYSLEEIALKVKEVLGEGTPTPH